MHLHFLDPYQARRSLVHQMDARIKVVLVVAFILTAAMVPPGAWPVYILLLSLVVAFEVLSELGVGSVIKRSSLALPFVLAAIPLMLTIPGPAVLSFGLGSWHFAVTVPGIERFLSVACKSWLSVQAAIVLAATTEFPQLLRALRALKLPRLLVAVIGLMWRYLFVLVDEALRLLRARSARSGHTDAQSNPAARRSGGSLGWRARVVGGMAGSLFLRAFERSDRIYVAMLARGYDGEIRSFDLPALRTGEILMMTAVLALLGILLLMGYLVWA